MGVVTQDATLKTGGFAAVDAIHQENASVVVQAIGVAVFTLLTIAGAQFRLYLWEVPFTLQTVAVYGSGLFLGWRNGALSQLLYLVIGLFFPVFAGDGTGTAYLLGAASAGYLWAYPFVAMTVGALATRRRTLSGSVLSMVVGSIMLFSAGVVWLHFAASHTTWLESFDKGWFRFIPVDLAKILTVALIYSGTRRIGR